MQAEAESSVDRVGAELFAMGQPKELPVKTWDGEVIARAVDAFASCQGGSIHSLIVRVGSLGGVGETLRRLPLCDAVISGGEIPPRLNRSDFAALVRVEGDLRSLDAQSAFVFNEDIILRRSRSNRSNQLLRDMRPGEGCPESSMINRKPLF